MPESERELTASAADCGANMRGLLARFDRATSSWKTSQLCLGGEWAEFSETWPRAGMTRNGRAFELLTLALRTGEKESGLWPTPNLPNGGRCLPDGTTRTGMTPDGKKRQVDLANAVKRWPTPRANEARAGDYQYDRGNHGKPRLTLNGAVKMWPTPTQADSDERTLRMKSTDPLFRESGMHAMTLDRAVHLWPTPTAITDTGGAALCKWGGQGAREKLRSMVTPEELNGSLNPTWVEWLMGYPLGWTALEDSETPSSLKYPNGSDAEFLRPKRSECEA